jgi:hypothetical protein
LVRSTGQRSPIGSFVAEPFAVVVLRFLAITVSEMKRSARRLWVAWLS